MEANNNNNKSNAGERVASTYADIFFNDDYCDYNKIDDEESETPETLVDVNDDVDKWQSPSDLLIGIIDLTPPFTSKISRGKTHQGILAIGDVLIKRERDRFVRYMNKLLDENDVAWNHILDHEKSVVAQKVKKIYKEILVKKNKTLMEEINTFYESSLQDLENHMRDQVNTTLISTRASIISDINLEIKEKLEKEKIILQTVLQKRYKSEVQNMTHYYKLLLENEKDRNNKLINHALNERNDAVKAFYNQIQAENITSSMYMMCTERKRCRIKQFILDNYLNLDRAEKLNKIQERQQVIDDLNKKERNIPDINKEWELKIKKILELFLKFISFTLKLLPEQTTFLLDLEKMFVLQLNEITKAPSSKSSILVDEKYLNTFKFDEPDEEENICTEPFVIVGDTSDSIPTPHGSRETLASNVDLPMIRLQRQFIYAKCERFDEVKDFLESQRCKCRDGIILPPTPESETTTETPKTDTPTVKSESSNETLIMDDINILDHCPGRNCQDYAKRYSFPHLNSYLDYTEDNYRRVKAILGKPPQKDGTPTLINPKDIVRQELPFDVTHEKHHTTGTQYSSKEDLEIPDDICQCMKGATERIKPDGRPIKPSENDLKTIMAKRKAEIMSLINENPSLLAMFTDESFDFIYSVK